MMAFGRSCASSGSLPMVACSFPAIEKATDKMLTGRFSVKPASGYRPTGGMQLGYPLCPAFWGGALTEGAPP